MDKKLYYVEIANQNGKAMSAKTLRYVSSVATLFKSTAQQLGKIYVNIPFEDEDTAKRCCLHMIENANTAASVLKGCSIDAIQDQPRSERHYIVNFHIY